MSNYYVVRPFHRLVESRHRKLSVATRRADRSCGPECRCPAYVIEVRGAEYYLRNVSVHPDSGPVEISEPERITPSITANNLRASYAAALIGRR